MGVIDTAAPTAFLGQHASGRRCCIAGHDHEPGRLDGSLALARVLEGEFGRSRAALRLEVISQLRTHAGVAAIMFRTLAGKGINIQVISTSEIKISVLIAADYTELAIRALHTAYGLDG